MTGSPPAAFPPDPHDTLPNGGDFAAERLALRGQAYDAESIALAERVGVGAGWRCAVRDSLAVGMPDTARQFCNAF